MAGRSNEKHALTKREMLLGLNAVRQKLGRMPSRDEYTKNGLPPCSEYEKIFVGKRDFWGGKLKKLVPKLTKFQMGLEKRKSNGETLEDGRRTEFKSRDAIIFQMAEFERLFGFLPEESEWEEIYQYFDIPSLEIKKRFLLRTVDLSTLINENYPRIANARRTAGLKNLTYTTFGLTENDVADYQSEAVGNGILKALGEVVPEPEGSDPEVVEIDETEKVVVPVIEVPKSSMFRADVLEDLMKITAEADFKISVGIWRWVREVSLRLGHLVTEKEITQIPGALSFDELEHKLGARATWGKIVKGTGLKDPMLKQEENPKPKPKKVVDKPSQKVEQKSSKEVDDFSILSKDTAVEWLRRTCAERGYLINSYDIQNEPDWPSFQSLKRHLGPLEEWGQYVKDLNLAERPVPKKTYYRQLSFDRCVKFLRDAIKQKNGAIPSSREIAMIYAGSPSYDALIRYLGPHDSWSKYLSSEYDYADDIAIFDFDSILDELTEITEQADFGTSEGIVVWLRLVHAKLQRFPTIREIKKLTKMSYETFQSKLGLEKKDWHRILEDSNRKIKDNKVDLNTTMEADKMDENNVVEVAAITDGAKQDNVEAVATVQYNLRKRRFGTDEDAFRMLLEQRNKLGRAIRTDDFPFGNDFPSLPTFKKVLGSTKGWDALLDYYAEYGFNEELKEMAGRNRIPKANAVSSDDMLASLAKIYKDYGNTIPTVAAFRENNISPTHAELKRYFGDSRGWKTLVLNYLEKQKEETQSVAPEEESASAEVEDVSDVVAEETLVNETASTDDVALADEGTETIATEPINLKIPRNGRGAINLTLTINLRVSYDD